MMVQHYWQMKQLGTKVTLMDLLGWTQDFGFKNPRDRIYALLGLAADVEDPLLLPEYRLSPEEVFRRTATCLLVNKNSLDMLYKHGLPKLHSSPLSWVPSFHGLYTVTNFNSYSQLAQFDASASRSPEISLQEETKVLSVLGAVIDTVAATTDAWFGNAEQWKISQQETAADCLSWVSHTETLSEALQLYNTNTEPLEEALWRTICADNTANGMAPAQKYFRLCFRVWRYEQDQRLSTTFESSKHEVTAPAMQSLGHEIAEKVLEFFKDQKASTDFVRSSDGFYSSRPKILYHREWPSRQNSRECARRR